MSQYLLIEEDETEVMLFPDKQQLEEHLEGLLPCFYWSC